MSRIKHDTVLAKIIQGGDKVFPSRQLSEEHPHRGLPALVATALVSHSNQSPEIRMVSVVRAPSATSTVMV